MQARISTSQRILDRFYKESAGESDLQGWRSSEAHDPWLSRRAGNYLSRLRRRSACDVVATPASSSIVAWLETDIPVLYASDATWDLLVGYHECYVNLAGRCLHGGEKNE